MVKEALLLKNKILFLVDYPRLDYEDSQGNFGYGNTAEGKRFKKELSPLGLKENVNYWFAYTYNRVPEPDKVTRWGKVVTYKAPSKAQQKEMYPYAAQVVEKLQPDLVIPLGTIGSHWLTGQGITQVQGVASKADIPISTGTYSCWVLPMLSQSYIEQVPNLKIQRDLSLMLVKTYLAQGEKALVPERPDYVYVDTMDKARKLLAKCAETGELAWDLETSTLEPNSKGAKVLVFSFSWAEGHACALPLEHNEVYQPDGTTIENLPNMWSDDELKELYSIIRDLVKATTIGEVPNRDLVNALPDNNELIKVGHNIKYDEHFLLATHHIKEAHNVLDTMVGYYLEVSQDKTTSKHLSDLAFTLTTIGGYDEPLEEYKKWFKDKVCRELFKYKKDKISSGVNKQPDYQLEASNPELEDVVDWEYLVKYNFNTDKLRTWVLRAAIDIVNVNSTLTKLSTYISHNFTYELIPMEIMYYYAAGDADATIRIHHKLEAMMEADPRNNSGRIQWLYKVWYPRLVFALAEIQNNGIRLNKDYIKDIQREYNKEAERITEEMRAIPQVKDIEEEKQAEYELGIAEFAKPVKERDPALIKYRTKYKDKGTDFSPTSSEDVPKVLFRDAGYIPPYDKAYVKGTVWDKHTPENKLTWESYSTSAATLKEIEKQATQANDKDIAKLCHLLQEYSKVIKAKTAFADRLGEQVSNIDGNIHGSFSETGTATSRLSASRPNLQQLSHHTSNVHDLNYKYPIKRMFESSFEGGKLVNIDFSNLEFRVLGLLTKEESMTNAFLTGKDIHKDNASLAFDTPYEDVTKQQRQAAKAIGLTSL